MLTGPIGLYPRGVTNVGTEKTNGPEPVAAPTKNPLSDEAGPLSLILHQGPGDVSYGIGRPIMNPLVGTTPPKSVVGVPPTTKVLPSIDGPGTAVVAGAV